MIQVGSFVVALWAIAMLIVVSAIAAQWLGVSFSNQKASDWIAAIGGAIGGLGAAGAAWISLQATNAAEAQRHENVVARFEIERDGMRDAAIALSGVAVEKCDIARGLHKNEVPPPALRPLLNNVDNRPPIDLSQYINAYSDVARRCDLVLEGVMATSSMTELVAWRADLAELRIEISRTDSQLRKFLHYERERHGWMRG